MYNHTNFDIKKLGCDNLLYQVNYDAFYDKEKDEWLSEKCNNPDCLFCKDRPEKPSQGVEICICKHCGTKKSYNPVYDAMFCKKCDAWCESKCNDPNCEFCSSRPEKPSDCKT